MIESAPVRVRDMPWPEMQDLLRTIGPEMATLAKRGDEFAIKVMAKYQYAYEHPTDHKAHFEMRHAVEDYINRDLRLGELMDLGSKFGHRIEDDPTPGPRIFMPGDN